MNTRCKFHRIDNNKKGKVWFDDVKIVKGNASQTVIVEESNYYPFGLQHKGYNNVVSSNGNSAAQKFGFGGKELTEELGLQWHDFSARNYDASLGRWMNLDPLAEQGRRWSPYNFAMNNPVYFQDPDGMWPNPFAGIGEGIARAVRSKINSVNKSISNAGKSIGNGLKSVGNAIGSFFTAANRDSSQGGDGYNFVSKDGTNKGQRKGDNSIKTINADDIIGSAKSGATKFKGINKKSIIKTLKNGMSDGKTTIKLVETGSDGVSSMSTSNSSSSEPSGTSSSKPTVTSTTYYNHGVSRTATFSTKKEASVDSSKTMNNDYRIRANHKIDSIIIKPIKN